MKLIFENGTFCLINGENMHIGDGVSVDAFVYSDEYDNYTKAEGYLMLDEDESYLDICLTTYDEWGGEVECPVLETLALMGIEVNDGYDQSFVESFHPFYNCNEIAWLDDCYCALENEISNTCHWDMLAKEIVTDEMDEAICYDIYCRRCGVENDENPNFVNPISEDDEENFGHIMSIKYRDDILARIAYYEETIMGAAIDNFKNKLGLGGK